MPAGFRLIGCPTGGISEYVSAEISLEHPEATTYHDRQGVKLSALAYSLKPGEAGVFFVQEFSHTRRSQTIWDLMLEVTAGGKSETIDVNQEKLGGKHFVSAPSCGIDQYTWVVTEWIDSGVTSCSTGIG
jgi:hypothetical protein